MCPPDIPRKHILSIAKDWTDTPYQHQASVKGAGCDCLGLIRGIWRELYGSEPMEVPAYTPDWAESLGAETLLEAAQSCLIPISKDAAKPSVFALDIPGEYNGPLVGVGLDPFTLTDVSGGEENVTLGSPARIGALLTDLPSGPVGRWDDANTLDIFLPHTALSSLSNEAIYQGGNRFALDTETGWEVLQAAGAELIAPSTYRLSRLLRGQNGSDADMQAVIPSGARIIWLGAGWTDLSVPNSLIGETVPITAIASGRESDTLYHLYKAVHLRPLSPVHVKIRKENGQNHISWIRRTRIGGDSWAGFDVPLGEEEERYRVQLSADGTVIAEYETTESMLTLPSLQNADSLSISQASRAFGWGAMATLAL